MKLLLVNKFYSPVQGGIEQHVKDLAEGLQRLGPIDLQVLTANSMPVGVTEDVSGVSVRRVASYGKLSSAPIAPGLPFIVARSDADIIHAHFPSPPVEFTGRLLPEGRLLVVTFHSAIVRQKILGAVYSPVVSAYLRRADRIIVTSPDLLRETEILRPHRHKCTVIPLGINPEPFCPGEPEARQALEGKATQIRAAHRGRPIVLFVGRFIYYKGIDYLLDAFSQVIISYEARRRPDAAQEFGQRPLLMLVGAGPLEDDLRRQCRVLGLTDDVHFAGSIENTDLPAYFHASEFLVLPSIAPSEAFGLVQLEAHASGRPVISTNLPTGVPFVNQNGVTGKIVPPKDILALATAMTRLLDDPGLSRHLGEQGRARCLAEFTRDIMVERVFQVYSDLLRSQDDFEQGEDQSLGI